MHEADYGYENEILQAMRWQERLGWVATTLAVAGVVLNNCRLWPCFVLWIASNGICAAIHAARGPRALLVRDVIFLVLAVVGLWQWTH